MIGTVSLAALRREEKRTCYLRGDGRRVPLDVRQRARRLLHRFLGTALQAELGDAHHAFLWHIEAALHRLSYQFKYDLLMSAWLQLSPKQLSTLFSQYEFRMSKRSAVIHEWLWTQIRTLLRVSSVPQPMPFHGWPAASLEDDAMTPEEEARAKRKQERAAAEAAKAAARDHVHQVEVPPHIRVMMDSGLIVCKRSRKCRQGPLPTFVTNQERSSDESGTALVRCPTCRAEWKIK